MMPLELCGDDADGLYRPGRHDGNRRPGGFAQFVTVPACTAIELPAELDFHHAAVVMRHVPTAWNLLCNIAELEASDTVLVMGARGNLGSIGI